MSNILNHLEFHRDFIELRFKITPLANSLTNNVFFMESIPTEGEDVVQVEFKPIAPSAHYNSLTRTLHIFFTEQPSNGNYRFTISGLRTASGNTMPEESFNRTYDYGSKSDTTSPFVPSADITHVEDKSIKRDAFITGISSSPANTAFHVVSTNPEHGSIFVEEDHNNGRVEVVFSVRPSPQYINSENITIQRKKMGSIGRWEKMDANLSLDPDRPRLYIQFPAADDGAYFEDGYKYRVRLSKDIKTFAA